MLPDGITIDHAYGVARKMAREAAERRMPSNEVDSAAGWALARAIRVFRGGVASQFWACLRGEVRNAVLREWWQLISHGITFHSTRRDKRPRVVRISNAMQVPGHGDMAAEASSPLDRLIAAETVAQMTSEERELAWELDGSEPVDVARRMGVVRSCISKRRKRARQRLEALA